MGNINILGINISRLDKQAVLDRINDFLESTAQHYLVTVNPEFILEAGHDEEFFYILNHADLSVPDGFGLTCAAAAMFRRIHRYPGADMLLDILKIAQEKKKRVAILIWSKGLSRPDDISFAVRKNYPEMQFIVREVERENNYAVEEAVINFKPDLLFVSTGAPWQEKYIYHCLPQISSVRLAAGVGGAFDFFTGSIKRAPKAFRVIGLEWLWRLAKQPWRWKRIYRAVIMFPLKFIRWRFIRPFMYRSNVACLLYKKIGDKNMILVVERAEAKNHWQLPQGGREGENITVAGKRELQEEIGTDKIKTSKVFKNIYKYKFGNRMTKFNVPAKLAWGYKGQKQSLLVAEFYGIDEDIKLNFWEHSRWKWVSPENLIDYVADIRKDRTKIFLKKFNEFIDQNIY